MKIASVRSQSFKWLFAELVVVVLGILIAFQVDEWRTKYAARALEINLVEGMLADLNRYSDDFQAFENNLRISIDAGIELVDYLESDSPRDAERLLELRSAVTSNWYWRIMSPTYEGWRNSNRPDLISNDQLSDSLIQYFSSYLPYFEKINESYREAYNDFFDTQIGDFAIRRYKTDEPLHYSAELLILTPIDEIPSNLEFVRRLDIHINLSVNMLTEIAERGQTLREELRVQLTEHLESLH